MRPVSYLITFLLILVGFGVIFYLSFTYSPVPIDSTYSLLALAGIVLAAVIALLSQIKNIVEWVDRLIDGLTTGKGSELSWRRYEHSYRQYIFYRHRNFDVKGLSTQGTHTLELAHVFVELSMVPRPAHTATRNPVPLPKKLQTGSHTIWEFLQADAANEQNFAIIGPPGSGKTTLIKHMALTLSGPRAQRRRQQAPNKLPILLYLREHAKAIAAETDEKVYNLTDAIQLDLKRRDNPAPEGGLSTRLQRGDCLVMLDGLDEVADPDTRLKVSAWVDRHIQAYPRCRFIVTSRPHGYRSSSLSQATVLEINPFDSQQQARFVHNWYLANEIKSQARDDKGVRLDARDGAEDLLNGLQSTPKLADLAVNPLLLTMITTVHRYRSSLPGRRVELYAEICEVFLGKRRQSIGLTIDLTPAQRQRVLQPLAWHMMQNEIREIGADDAANVIKATLQAVNDKTTPAQFFRSIEEESGLLLEREQGEYAFAHLTFQEYLAAAHAQDQQLLPDLLPNVNQSWWHETLLLYAAQADATPIIKACLDTVGLPGINALLLAMACAEEGREVEPEVRKQLEQLLDETAEAGDEERARLVAEARLQRRLQRLVRVSETLAIDTDLITNAEYQLFLDELRAEGKHLQPDHWQQYRFPDGQANYPVLGIRPSDAVAFCTWLTDRIGGDTHFRLPHPDESELISTNKALQVNNAGYWAKDDGFNLIMAQGQPPIITSSSSLACHRVRVLANGLSKAIDNAFTIANNYDLDLAHAIARDLANALTLTNDLDLGRTLANGLDLALDLDRALDDASERALDRRSERFSNRVRAFDSARERASDLVRSLDRALDRARTFTRNLDHTSNHANDLAIDLVHAIDLARNRANTLAKDLTRIRNRDHALAVDLDLVRTLDRTTDLELDLEPFILFAGYTALMLLHFMQKSEEEPPRSKRQQKEYQQWQETIEDFANEYLHLFVVLCILQERTKGNLPAFEGIRLVREKKPGKSTY